MNERVDRGRQQQQSVVIPEYFAKILRNKDRVIRDQARRIELLEEEVHRLRMTREAMSSQLALLSCKIKILSAKNSEAGYGNDSRVSVSRSHQINHRAAENNLKRTESVSDRWKSNCNDPLDSQLSNRSNHLISHCGNRDSELLEKKYGDYTRANRAALKIQRTYRKYSLNRNFQKLRQEVGDSSRRSERFTKLAAGHNSKASFDRVPQTDRSTIASKNAAGSKLQNRIVDNGESRNRSSHSPNSDSGVGLTNRDLQSARQEERLVVSDRRKLKSSVDRYFQSSNGKDFFSDNKNISCLNTTTVMTVDLPSFDFESLLEDRNKNPTLFLENSKKDGNWSSPSSSSSPIVSTPVDSIPTITYVDENCIKDSEPVDNILITFKSNETNCDANLLQSAFSTPSDYSDNVFLSVPSPQPNCFYSSSKTDSNCVRLCQPDKHSSGQRSSNQGHYNYEHKLSLAHTIHHNGSERSPRQRIIHIDSETPEPIPASKLHKFDSDIVCSSGKIDGDEFKNVMCNSSRKLHTSSSSSDVASSGSISGSAKNDKIPLGRLNSEISSEEYELLCEQRVNMHLTDKQRKRKYRIGLNLFNRKPEKGIRFLIDNQFLDNKPRDIAHFLLTRKGLSRQMIGEYLGNLLQQFNMEVLECFVSEIDFSGIPIDKALRKFQSHFRLPGEAQKIEKLMEAFASSYITSNPDVVKKFAQPDTVFLIAYAIIMLNTDLHNSSIKPDRKMKLQDFIRNLRGIDGGKDVDPNLLTGVFDRIAACPLKSAEDHVTQVMKVEKMILGKKPLLSESHRRLICYCRLYEIKDRSKREKSNMHQREVFLFNDLLLITKLNSRKKDSLSYSYRESFHLFGMMMVLFELPNCKHGVQLTSNLDNRVLITLCAGNETDRIKFVEDLNEAIIEVNEMEAVRIQEEFGSHSPSLRDSTNILHRKNDYGSLGRNPNHLRIGENRLSASDCTAPNKLSHSSSNGDASDDMNHLSSGSRDSGLLSVNSGSTNGGFQVRDGSVENPRNAQKFSIFTHKPRTSKPSTVEPI